MRIINRANLPEKSLLDLERELPEVGTLQELVDWGSRQRPSLVLIETVALDEYTHDVIASWKGDGFFVFGST